MSRYFSPLQKEVKAKIGPIIPKLDIPDDYCQVQYKLNKPFPHQTFLSEYFKKYDVRGMLLYHEVGSGKTYTSILAVKQLLSLYPDRYTNIYLIAPEVLYSNYISEIRKFLGESEKLQTKINFINVENITGSKIIKGMFENSIVVIDEVHVFANKIINMLSAAMLLYKQLFDTKVVKFIQLSATPIYDSPFELCPIFNLCAGKAVLPVDGQTFSDEYIDDSVGGVYNYNRFRELIEGYVSYYRGAVKNKTIYPQIGKKFSIGFDISSKQQELISKLKDSNILNYLPGQEILSAVDGVDISDLENYSEKLKYLSTEIPKSTGKVLIYTKFSNTSKILLKYFKLLQESSDDTHSAWKDISFIHLNIQNFDDVINKINDIKSNIKVIILDSHLRYGITLKNVKKLIIMEPYPMFNEIGQIVGRIQRICSHADLPKSERFIELQILYIRASLDWKVWKTGLQFYDDNNAFLELLRDAAVDRLLYDDIYYRNWLYDIGYKIYRW